MTKENQIKNLIQDLNVLLDEIERIKDFLKSTGRHERHLIAREILSKIRSLLSDSIKADDLLSKYATLRYVFETLINVRLLNKETNFTYKLYYSIFKAQVDKTEKLLTRINQEIEIAKNYNKREENELGELNKFITNINPTEFKERHHSIVKNIDKDFEHESLIFFGDYKNMGYGYTVHLLETKVKLKYEKRLKELKEKLEKVKNDLFISSIIKSIFSFKTREDVIESISDKRTWKKKAADVKLESDYDLVYDLSSSVLHSTSYSIFTDNELDDSDKELVHEMVTRNTRNIVREIEEYLDLKRLKSLIFVNV